MAKATATKKPVVRRRRERKNIENGSAHIQSTSQTFRATHYHGHLPVKWVSEAQESQLPSQLRQPLKQQLRQLWNTV